VTVGACNANTGAFEVFDNTLSRTDFIDAVIASSAMPAIFPY